MPIYDYTCTSCGHLTEVVHGIHDAGPKFCPNCGAEGTMRKAFAPPTVLFKGSGWAKKDRAATVSPGKAKPAAKSGEESAGSSGSGSPAEPTPAKASTADGGS